MNETPIDNADGQSPHERRTEALREELDRRLEFFESADESVFGAFTTVDWILCTLIFFALPLIVLALVAP